MQIMRISLASLALLAAFSGSANATLIGDEIDIWTSFGISNGVTISDEVEYSNEIIPGQTESVDVGADHIVWTFENLSAETVNFQFSEGPYFRLGNLNRYDRSGNFLNAVNLIGSDTATIANVIFVDSVDAMPPFRNSAFTTIFDDFSVAPGTTASLEFELDIVHPTLVGDRVFAQGVFFGLSNSPVGDEIELIDMPFEGVTETIDISDDGVTWRLSNNGDQIVDIEENAEFFLLGLLWEDAPDGFVTGISVVDRDGVPSFFTDFSVPTANSNGSLSVVFEELFTIAPGMEAFIEFDYDYYFEGVEEGPIIVPEPCSFVMTMIGLTAFGLVAFRQRRRRRPRQ